MMSALAVHTVRRLLTVLAVASTVNSQSLNGSANAYANGDCVQVYFDLERSLFSNTVNIDSLTRTWFPPNEQTVPVVEVFYYINDSSLTEHPLTLELQGLESKSKLRQKADYRYRWSLNPIYLFMDPQVLEALSLHVIRIRRHEARLVVDPICENYSLEGIRLPEFYLNQMTSLLKSYAVMREQSLLEGIDEQSQGYASFYNSTRGDFIVLEFDEDYQGSMFLLAISLIALAVFVTIVIPLLIYFHYNTLYDLARDEDSDYVFIIWGNVTVSVIIVFLILVVDLIFVVNELNDSPPSLWQYALALALVIVLIVFDLGVAMVLPRKDNFPVPRLLKLLYCQQTGFPTIVAQIIAIWFVIMAMQLVTFHASFVFLAFIASPVQAASTALLYVAATFCGVSLATLFFAVFQQGRLESKQRTLRFICQRLIYVILFMCVLTFVILFSTTFLRVTVYVGDFESGGLPSLFASLAPSILLGALGFVAKSVLQRYNRSENGSNQSQEMADTAGDNRLSSGSDANDVALALSPTSQGNELTTRSRSRSPQSIGTSI